jgi:aminodeoxyfutalosine deaminase
VIVTINTDDPPLFNTTLSQEYQLLIDHFGYSMRDVVRLARNAFQVSGAEAALKSRWLAEFDQWVSANTL